MPTAYGKATGVHCMRLWHSSGKLHLGQASWFHGIHAPGLHINLTRGPVTKGCFELRRFLTSSPRMAGFWQALGGMIRQWHFDGLRDRKAFAIPWGQIQLRHSDGLGDRKAFGRPWGMFRQWHFDRLREWHGFCQPKKPTPDWRGGVAVAGRQWRG